jgi:hypothetical protein
MLVVEQVFAECSRQKWGKSASSTSVLLSSILLNYTGHTQRQLASHIYTYPRMYYIADELRLARPTRFRDAVANM